ncbi:MAG: signal peptide peptidase SppA [Phycisphaerae bacterium]|nr:signal peptide peptidase SppA [Phycisphaerae bacterium]
MSQYPGHPGQSYPPPPAITGGQQPIIVKSSFTRGALGVMTGVVAVCAIFGFGLVIGFGGGAAAVSGGVQLERSELRAGFGGEILVVPVEGGIDDGMAGFIAECASEIDAGNAPDAIILRVDSGGGGVSASDRIWKIVQDWQAKGITVVASFGGTAASGGYYVACSCDQIVAEPTCITGSIGVIAQMFTLQGLTDKVGIAPMTIVATGSPRKDVANDMFRTWTDKDRAVVQGILDDAYATFTKRVLDGRAIQFSDLSDVQQVADGSVYTAQKALDAGLVDSIGYLEDAIAVAESLTGLAAGSSTVSRLSRPVGLFDSPFGVRAPPSGASALGLLSQRDLRDLAAELAQPRVMYQMQW